MADVMNATRALLRLSVQSEGRRLDIAIPAQVPVIEFLPGFARSLGVLDASMTSAGYALQRADGSTVDPSLGASAQGIVDGEVLTLVRGGLVAQPRVYDDIVEAVIDATAQQNRPWTTRDNARTALAVSLALLGVCAVLLLAAGRALPLGLSSPVAVPWCCSSSRPWSPGSVSARPARGSAWRHPSSPPSRGSSRSPPRSTCGAGRWPPQEAGRS